MKYSELRVLSTTKEKLKNGQISILIKTHSQRYFQKCGNEGALRLTITLIKNVTNKNNSIALPRNPICCSFPVQTRDQFVEEEKCFCREGRRSDPPGRSLSMAEKNLQVR